MAAPFTLKNTSPAFLSVFVGVCAFFIICGPRFLDPTNVAWLVGGDPLQHYLGWVFYRNSPWSWPLGLSPMYGMDFSNSIVFTDSIPLLAIPFKAISPMLPNTFQYFGIWVLICFVLQAYFAFRLIGLFSNSIAIQCMGCILFLISPPMLFRLSLHESLIGHFFILASLYLNLQNSTGNSKIKHTLMWTILLGCAAMVHFYLFVMVGVLWSSDLASRLLLQKTITLPYVTFEIFVVLIATAFVFWQAGYFSVPGSAGSTNGFGDFRTNLLALFNSRGWSYWIRPIPLRDSVEAATGEGFQFLGAGPIFLLICIIFGFVKSGHEINLRVSNFFKKYLFLLIALTFLALLSFSNKVGIGPWNFYISMPDSLLGILSFVRSSSRLFWPLYYGIILAILYFIVKIYKSKIALLLISLGAIFQLIDTSAGWLLKKEQLTMHRSSQFTTQLKNPFWVAAGRHYKNVVTDDLYGVWEDFGIFASQNKMATSITHLARSDANKASIFFHGIHSQLYSAKLDPNNLYILRDWKSAADKAGYAQIKFNPKEDLLAHIDGFNVLAPGWKICPTCPQVSSSLELAKLTPEVNINKLIDFTKKGDGRAKFILNGWGYTEDWGTWAIEPSAFIVLPLPNGEPKKILVKANAFLAPSHPKQEIEILLNGIKLPEKVILEKQNNNVFEIRLPSELTKEGDSLSIEFKSINAVSPSSIGLSPDDRKLGIGLISVQFSR